MDSDQSTALNGTAQNANFSLGGIKGQAVFLNNTAEAPFAYYRLGTYPEPTYCFPSPAVCPNGTSIAFWLNIPEMPAGTHGYITTALDGGPGFALYSNWGGKEFLLYVPVLCFLVPFICINMINLSGHQFAL